MSAGALIMMIGWQSLITLTAGYFFYRVLTAKSKPDNQADDDSYSDNDDENKSSER